MYFNCYTLTEKQWHAFVNQHHPRLNSWWERLLSTSTERFFLEFDICNALTNDGKQFTVYTNIEL